MIHGFESRFFLSAHERKEAADHLQTQLQHSHAASALTDSVAKRPCTDSSQSTLEELLGKKNDNPRDSDNTPDGEVMVYLSEPEMPLVPDPSLWWE